MPRLLTFTSHRHLKSLLRTPCEKRGHSIMSVPSACDRQPYAHCGKDSNQPKENTSVDRGSVRVQS